MKKLWPKPITEKMEEEKSMEEENKSTIQKGKSLRRHWDQNDEKNQKDWDYT